MAQPVNLVPNGSFEDTIDFNNGFFAPKNWDMTLGSPDYFTSLFDPPYDSRRTPQNFYGFQYPNSVGNAYVGFSIKNLGIKNAREYIQIKLRHGLVKDSLYNLSFWVNMPDSFHLSIEFQNLAFSFSDTMIEYPQHLHKLIDWLSPIYFSNLTWDSMNKLKWQNIGNTIKAKGGERYLVIGNFLPDSLTQLTDVGGGVKSLYKNVSYYYIDNIELVKYTSQDNLKNPINELIIPNIFTPNADGINDVWKLSNPDVVSEISVYNRWGDLIKKIEGPDFLWEGNNSSSGIYFYKITYTEKQVEKVKTGTITLIR